MNMLSPPQLTFTWLSSSNSLAPPPQLTWFSKQVRRASHYSNLSRSRSFTLQWSGAPLVVKRDRLMNMAITQADDSRPLANFHPNIWGDRFLLSKLEYDQLIEREKKLSQKVGALIQGLKTEFKEIDHPFELLKLIDTIQRLGIGYHFEGEINRALQDIYDNYLDYLISNSDLYTNALTFRLLRQQGHKVTCDIFDKFKDVKGEFKASITSDVMGMLEFYEATFLSIQGEDILDQGLDFTRAYLHSVVPNLSTSPIGKQVFHALNNSIRRGIPRLEARKYISIYEQQVPRHENLLQLAKLDYNLLQSLHKRELSELYSWWKCLDVPVNFSYAKDRFVEAYIWALVMYFEPQYAVARNYFSRIMPLLTIIDDTYDAYGTFEELQSFTKVIESWAIPSSNSLSGCMKLLYKTLWDVVNEIEDEMVKVGGEYRATYAKERIISLVRTYFEEAKWVREKYKPETVEDYMVVAIETSGFITSVIISYIGMGNIATNDAFEWLLTSPALIKAGANLSRFSDDIGGHEFEQQRNHIPSAVQCYMKEHDVSQQEAVNELNNRIEIAWKDINEILLMTTKIPTQLLDRILNLSRLLDVLYKKGDCYTHVGPEMQSYIKQLLIDPVLE